LRPYAQKADREGNVLMWGIVGAQKEIVMAARRAIATVEEVVDRLDAPPNSVVLPAWIWSAVCPASGGAFPSYALGYYGRDNAFYKQWDSISRDRETFLQWIRKHIQGTKNFDQFRQSLYA
jgi:glutaconate CoA-transferase subunit A